MTLYWCADRDTYRVWREDWRGDQFEVLTSLEFKLLGQFIAAFGLPVKLIEHDEEEV